VMQLQVYNYYGRGKRGREMDMQEKAAFGGRGQPMPAMVARAAADAPRRMNKAEAFDDRLADKKDVDSKNTKSTEEQAKGENNENSEGGGEARVRSYFPETLYVNPNLITDKQGRATIRIPLADSITTWRISMLASTKQGALGSNTAGIKVF